MSKHYPSKFQYHAFHVEMFSWWMVSSIIHHRCHCCNHLANHSLLPSKTQPVQVCVGDQILSNAIQIEISDTCWFWNFKFQSAQFPHPYSRTAGAAQIIQIAVIEFIFNICESFYLICSSRRVWSLVFDFYDFEESQHCIMAAEGAQGKLDLQTHHGIIGLILVWSSFVLIRITLDCKLVSILPFHQPIIFATGASLATAMLFLKGVWWVCGLYGVFLCVPGEVTKTVVPMMYTTTCVVFDVFAIAI